MSVELFNTLPEVAWSKNPIKVEFRSNLKMEKPGQPYIGFIGFYNIDLPDWVPPPSGSVISMIMFDKQHLFTFKDNPVYGNKSKNIGVTGALFNSFKQELVANGGNVGAVILKFAMYGRFRDMGVGRGMKAYERKTNKVNMIAAKAYGTKVSYSRRQAKRWYPKVKTYESLRLQEILVRDLGVNIQSWIATDWADS